MPSWSALAVQTYIEWIRRSKEIFSDAEKTRGNIQALYIRPQSFLPPPNLGPDIILDRVDVTEWPLYRGSSHSPSISGLEEQARNAMLYCHGGAFYREIDPQHWKFVVQMSRETGLDVLVPIYPLIPRPTATAQKLAKGLVEICRLSKQPVVCIAGDSAGGTLALTTMQNLPQDLANQVRSLVLISPLLDCALDHSEIVRLAQTDPWLGLAGCRVLAELWRAGLPDTDPIASPLYGDISRLPQVLLMCGTQDMLCADARRLSAKYQGKDASECVPGSVDLENFTYVEASDMLHVYPLLPHWEGGEARKQIVEFISTSLK